ncbi:MAG: NAD(P)-dependent alcohol dehydrogenase, partial [Balneolaceae bacterium]|nr:NAD(P)-dependent alcohol dehydrogenase [Balneolaceae bacterium]
MKAILFPKYGPPDVLQLEEVEKPTPKENEVLIKVHAAAANPLDWRRMEADPWFVRMSEGFFTPNDPRLGADMAGVIKEVGSKVTEFKPGDAVFGCSKGAFAEYACFPEDVVALKPATISFEEAASIPIVGYTALQGLRDYGEI